MKHIFAFRAPLKRHDSEANFKLKKEKKTLSKTNTTKLLPGRIPIDRIFDVNTLSPTMYGTVIMR